MCILNHYRLKLQRNFRLITRELPNSTHAGGDTDIGCSLRPVLYCISLLFCADL